MTRDEKLKPIHPGEILREELLIPLNISGGKLAQELKVDKEIIAEIIAEKRSITPDIALRLSCYFPQSAQF
ncbi:MAG: HigA family addiction module antitoxin [Mollicutes bacterium UO1]